jgi:hypothetical protein
MRPFYRCRNPPILWEAECHLHARHVLKAMTATLSSSVISPMPDASPIPIDEKANFLYRFCRSFKTYPSGNAGRRDNPACLRVQESFDYAFAGGSAFPIEIHTAHDPQWRTYEEFRAGVREGDGLSS